MELITVGLYGDGSKSARLKAEYVYCDRAEKCSCFRNGKCFGVTTFLGDRCPYSKINSVDGGLKRSKAYERVYSEAKNSEKYAKLSYPHNTMVAKIGDEAFLAIPFIRLEVKDGELTVDDPFITNKPVCVPANLLTPESLKKMCSFHPQAFLGGEITNYQEETVPMFLAQLSRLFPEQYQAFIKVFPEYAERKPNWIGQYAILSTCNREATYLDASGNAYHFEGDYIVGMSNFAPFALFTKAPTEVRIKITDDMRVKITAIGAMTIEEIDTQEA